MKIRHVALAGFVAAAFATAAVAGGNKQHQSSDAQSQPQQQSSSMPGSSSSGSSSQASSQSPELVRQAQAELANKGHDVQVDGKMGPQTQAALKEFQQSQGMQASGQLDQQTISALGVSGGDPGSSTGSSSGSRSGSQSGG